MCFVQVSSACLSFVLYSSYSSYSFFEVNLGQSQNTLKSSSFIVSFSSYFFGIYSSRKIKIFLVHFYRFVLECVGKTFFEKLKTKSHNLWVTSICMYKCQEDVFNNYYYRWNHTYSDEEMLIDSCFSENLNPLCIYIWIIGFGEIVSIICTYHAPCTMQCIKCILCHELANIKMTIVWQ